MTHSKFKKGLKIISLGFFIILGILGIALLYFHSQKDKIIHRIVEDINQKIEGKINYTDIVLAPLSSFPDVTFSVSGLSLQNSSLAGADTLVKFNRMRVSFDLPELLRSRIDLRNLALSRGEIKLIQLPDSSYSILEALQMKEQKADSSAKKDQLILNIEKFSAEDIDFVFTQIEDRALFKSTISELSAELYYSEDSLAIDINLLAFIDSLNLNKKSVLSQNKLSIKGGLDYAKKEDILYLKELDLQLFEALFSVNGTIELAGEQNINVDFTADDSDLKFTRLFLASSDTRLIESGSLHLKGEIHGTMKDEIPEISCSFGSNKLNLKIPKTEDHIKDLYFKGTFKSGRKRDLSEAMMHIDSISAALPEGSVSGELKMKDFKHPYLDLTIDLSTRIDALEQVFNISSFDSLSGSISLNGSYKGSLELSDSIKTREQNELSLTLSEVSFVLTKDFRFSHINGDFKSMDDQLQIDSTSLLLNQSSIQLSGSIQHYFSLFIDLKKAAIADLKITTPLFYFPDFFDYSTTIASSFPYKIQDVDLQVKMTSSKRELSDFKKLPQINFNIEQLSCKIPELCPPIELKGNFLLNEKEELAQLDFRDFLLHIGTNPLSLNLFYSYSESIDDSLSISSHVDTLNLGQNLYFSFLSSLKDSNKLILDGDLYSEIVWDKNNEKGFKKIDFRTDSLHYETDKFTVNTTGSRVLAKNINNINEGSYPFSKMNGNIAIDIKKIYSNLYQDENIHFDIDINKGQFVLDANYSSEPFNNLKINLNSRPFDSIPSYSIKHSAANQDIKKIFPPKGGKSVLFGETDLELDLSFKGSSQKDLLQSINGYVLLKGDSMLLMGYDIDNLIKKFQRSQNFNLVDLGAVLIAGPVGILYTKGSDYAMMMVGNKKDSTIINQFYSKWAIESGVFSIKDFAFATAENRIAVEGWISMNSDSLDMTIALVDTLGCSIISQNLIGNIDHPKPGKVRIIKTALAPVTNLADKTLNIQCDVFYDGVVKPLASHKKDME